MCKLKAIFKAHLLLSILTVLSIIPFESGAQNVLKTYLDEGLKNNQNLQTREIALDQSLLALKEAKTYYLPSADFQTQYTLAAGGRSIDLPIGDMLNGVYTTLNQLTNSESFPQLTNVSEQFLPNNFYDAKIRIAYPILNSDRRYNKSIRQTNVKLEENEIEIYKAELIMSIRQAYYQYCMAFKAIEVYTTAQTLVNQNIRDTEIFIKNGKALPAQLMRAKSEASSIESRIIAARLQLENARNYFNFLLNKDPESEVIFSEPDLPESMESFNSIPQKRTEIIKLETAMEIQSQVIESKRQFYMPKVNAFIDLGSQAFNFEFGRNSLYAMAGLQVEIPLFNGNRNRIQTQHARLDLNKLQLQKDLVEDQLSLTSRKAYNEVLSAQALYKSSEEQLKAAQAYFNLIDKGYKDGRHTMIEYLDARNQLTQSSLQKTISAYQILIAQAVYDRETGNSNF
ncbi:MAG: TolC family protein [Saprospiraceae bacterium]|nr:TolC family protein [Saprospiraceae bacterium]